jgi:hypothetical protein
MSSMNIPFTLAAIVVMVATYAYLVSYSYLIVYVREGYPTVWRDLGEPIALFGGKMPNDTEGKVGQFAAMFRVWRFVLGNQSVVMRDRRLTILIWSVRVPAVMCLGGWVNLLIFAGR